jgi:hypothetical protein
LKIAFFQFEFPPRLTWHPTSQNPDDDRIFPEITTSALALHFRVTARLEMEIFWEVENFDSNVSMPCAIYCCHN